MIFHDSVLEGIGNTPTVSLKKILPKHAAEIFVKLEGYNPAGSIKDRPALNMILQAERLGKLKLGGTIIESSSGNLGVALAMVASVKNYRCIIVVDPRTSKQNIAAILAFGAKVDIVTEINPNDGTYQEARIRRVQELCKIIPGAFMPYQYGNPHNPQAHENTTALEILEDFPGGPDVVIAAVSTAGHISGISKTLKKMKSKTKTIGVDVRGSVVFGGCKGPTAVTGMGLGWVPENLDKSVIDEAYLVETQQCFSIVRYVAKKTGLLLGGSTGAALFIALNQSLKLGSGKSILAISADRGEKYLDEFYNESWMLEKGLTTEDDFSQIIMQAKIASPFMYPSEDVQKVA